VKDSPKKRVSREGMTSYVRIRRTERDNVGGVEVKGSIGDSTYMQISSCENSNAGGRIVSDKATGSQGQYQSNDGKRVADDPGNIRGGSRGKKINGPWHAGWFNRDKTVLIAIGYAR